MQRFPVILAVFLLVSAMGFAGEPGALEQALDDFSKGISQTAYTMQERENSAERLMYERAVARTEKAEQALRGMIGAIESPEEMQRAVKSVETFGKKDKLSKHAADAVLKMLHDRAVFLNVAEVQTLEDAAPVERTVVPTRAPAPKPRDLLSRSQRRLIMIDVPVAEAAVYLDDNKEERRVGALKELLPRAEPPSGGR